MSDLGGLLGPAAPMPVHQQATSAPRHWVIGFNFLIDRLSIARLMSVVGAALDASCSGITLCISSAGGAPDQAFYVFEILSRLPVPLTTHNIGITQSAAVVLFMAGQRRYCSPGSTFLMHATTHAPATGSNYSADQITLTAESITADDERSVSIIAARSGQSVADIRKWFRGQKLRTAQFAQQHGLIDDIKPLDIPQNGRFFQVTL